MSIRVMTQVWDSGCYEGGTLLVLLALADWAKDDGTKVFPTIAQVMDKARLSERGARDCMRRLEKDHVIVLVAAADGTRGRANEWRIDLERLREVAAIERLKRKPPQDESPRGQNLPPSQEQPVNIAPAATQQVAVPVATDQSPTAAGDGHGGSPQHARGQFATEATGANADAHGGNLAQPRGQIEAVTGADSSIPPTPPYIDQPSYQPSLQPSSHPPSTRARVDEVKAEEETIPAFLRRVWPEGFQDFMALPWHPSSSASETEAAWQTVAKTMKTGAPPWPHILKSGKAYHAALSVGRKDDPAHAMTAQRFVRSMMWLDYPPIDEKVKPEPVPPQPVWDGHPVAEQLRREYGAGTFDTWLAPCRLEQKDGAVILHAPRRLIRDIVATQYIARLEKAFGVPVAVSLESEAA